MSKFLKIAVIICGVLLLVVLVGPFLIPIPTLKTVPPSELADPDSKFMDINGIQVHYKEAGSGTPAIILLHGFGASVFSWREVISPLSSLGTVYAYDRPGFGLTSRPFEGEWQGDNPYSLMSQEQMLLDFMDNKEIEKAILVGNSAGGTVATLFTLNHPDRVLGLVEVDAAVLNMGENQSSPWMSFLLDSPQAERLGPLMMRTIRKWGTQMIQTAWHDPEKIPTADIAGYQEPLQADGWDKALFEILKARKPVDLETNLKDLYTPVLVITGDDDQIVPTADSIRLAGLIQGAELAIIPDCGHVPQEECPNEFLEKIVPFISKFKR